jgi:hypothetical protein
MATAPPVLPGAQDPGTGFTFNTATNSANANKVPADAATLPGVTVTATRADVVGDLSARDDITPQPNVLDRFASYTYSASVYLMSARQYERLLLSNKKNINGYFLLFQSGGAPTNKGGFLGKGSGEVGGQDPGTGGLDAEDVEDFGRNPAFPQDFYIDSITIDNALPGQQTQAAHMVTELKFTVVEPGNITLLDRLYRAVQDAGQVNDSNQPVNYTAAVYLMVIRWYGYDIDGNLVQVGAADPNTGLTDPNAVVEKYIPFLIKKINWSVNSKLVTYDFECAPVAQMVAGYTRRGTIPYDAQFTASSVRELLGGDLVFVTPGGQQADVRRIDNAIAATPNSGSSTAAPPKASGAPTSSQVIKQGLMASLNKYQQELVKKGKYEVADTYSIEFDQNPDDPDLNIADATLRLPGSTVTQSRTSMGVAAETDPNNTLNPDTDAMKIDNRNYSVTAGMQIIQVIDLVIRNSSYIAKQQLTTIDSSGVERPDAQAQKKPMSWFKISMEARQGKYDKLRRDYAYNIVFVVTPYTLQDFDSTYFPLTKFRGVHKSYPYWFTGQNTAVLDFTANFNNLYNLTVTGTSKEDSGTAAIRRNFTSSMRDIAKYTYAASSTETRTGEDGRALEAQANAAEYLYSPGNMGDGALRIIGDPAWIQQGSMAGRVSAAEFSYSAFLPDGTINFDAQQVMYEVAWQRPNDYDLNTGLADPYAGGDTKNRLPIQSSVYLANRVISEFRQGRFEQTIKGSYFRFPKPDGSNTVGKSASTVATNGASLREAQNRAAGNDSVTDNPILARQNAQSPSAALANGNSALDNGVKTAAAAVENGALPAAVSQATNIGGSSSVSPVNSNNAIAPSAYPRAPTGSGVSPITFAENSPPPLNTSPYALAGRTQTIVKEA